MSRNALSGFVSWRSHLVCLSSHARKVLCRWRVPSRMARCRAGRGRGAFQSGDHWRNQRRSRRSARFSFSPRPGPLQCAGDPGGFRWRSKDVVVNADVTALICGSRSAPFRSDHGHRYSACWTPPALKQRASAETLQTLPIESTSGDRQYDPEHLAEQGRWADQIVPSVAPILRGASNQNAFMTTAWTSPCNQPQRYLFDP
jgi:hypothetical protein